MATTTDSEENPTVSIRVRLTSDMLCRLTDITKSHGMPVATLATYAIGRFVQSIELSRMAALSAPPPSFENLKGFVSEEKQTQTA